MSNIIRKTELAKVLRQHRVLSLHCLEHCKLCTLLDKLCLSVKDGCILLSIFECVEELFDGRICVLPNLDNYILSHKKIGSRHDNCNEYEKHA